jgi:hypothetical protein
MPFLSECRGSVAFYTPIKKLHQQNIFNYRHLTPVKLMAFSYWEGIYLRGRVNRRKMKKGKEKRGKRIVRRRIWPQIPLPLFEKTILFVLYAEYTLSKYGITPPLAQEFNWVGQRILTRIL